MTAKPEAQYRHLVDSGIIRNLGLCLHYESYSFSLGFSSMGFLPGKKMPTNLTWIVLGTGIPWPGALAFYLCDSLCLSSVHWMDTSHIGLLPTPMERLLVEQGEIIKGYFLSWSCNISFSFGVCIVLIEVIQTPIFLM